MKSKVDVTSYAVESGRVMLHSMTVMQVAFL